uniref:Uncharacterized protein n=1 Tax=Anguilla anguilla TaxID=7936 RepID=A0A0E9QIZ3_ANGAN
MLRLQECFMTKTSSFSNLDSNSA